MVMSCRFSIFSLYSISKSIVLGENNANTKIDCDNFNVCAEPVQEFGPEKIIFPSNYNYPAFRHDIALIKLNREAKISGKISVQNEMFHFSLNIVQNG